MKYVVTRYSKDPGENPECPGAQKEIVTKWGELVEAYTIDIDSLEELHRISWETMCPLGIVIVSAWGYDLPVLELYDGYGEEE